MGTRPTGMPDPDPEVPPEPIIEIALHRGESPAGVILDLPGSPTRAETTLVEVAAVATNLVRSQNLPLLTETERRSNLLFSSTIGVKQLVLLYN